MDKYWSDLTKSLHPYVPGEQPQDQKYIKLNTNENPYPPSNNVYQKLQSRLTDALRLYPDPESKELKTALAKYYQVNTQNVFVGNGSDEVLALSFLAFFKDKSISFPDITYSFYPVYCDIFQIKHECFALNKDFKIDVDSIPTKTGGIIFPNPNAPTGIGMRITSIENILQKHPDSVVIVDEAYIDFGGESCIPLVEKYHNLLVIQTFSKSRSLAGLRVGYAIGHEDLIEGIDRVKNSFNSYPLDTLATQGAIAALEDKTYFENCCNNIIQTRSWVESEMKILGFKSLPSQSNFLFTTHPEHEAEKLYLELKKQGVLVRYFNKPKIKDYLRITIGTDDEMRIFCEKLKVILE